MSITGDFFIGASVSPDTLRVAVAHAANIDPSQVGLRVMGSGVNAYGRIVIVTVENHDTGDYPGQYLASLDDEIGGRFGAMLSALSQSLHAPILSGAGLDDPDIMMLSLPNGSVHHVLVEQEGDGSIRNTPEMRALIAPHQPPSRVRAA